MKKLFAAAALLAAIASPALADDKVDPDALGAMVSIVYDSGCEKLPRDLMYGIALKIKDIPDAVLAPANKMVHDAVVAEGPAAWCARIKPLIWKHIKESQ